MTIGKNMQKLRESHGWTQRETAKRLHLEPSTYSRYESDDVIPPVSNLMAIAQLFGVTLDELTGFVTKKENRLNRVDEALYRLKEMGVAAVVEDDVVKFDLYGTEHIVNISDIADAVHHADMQYDKMLVDIKGLYNAALEVVLAGGKYDTFYIGHPLDFLSVKQQAERYKKRNNCEITIDGWIEWLRKDLVLMSNHDRNLRWKNFVKLLVEEGIVKEEDFEKDGRWKCPFAEVYQEKDDEGK